MKSDVAEQPTKKSRGKRIKARMPVHLESGGEGFTKDISVTGMYLVQDAKQEVGSHVKYTISLMTPAGEFRLSCEGEIVRVDADDNKVGLGIRVVHQFGANMIFDQLKLKKDELDKL
ncbi:MAG: PilZ domain-containing protein [Betaproteobacteria bacterium]|nr:PilZ domain-containing protein [Betaproteobacteria bacterium]